MSLDKIHQEYFEIVEDNVGNIYQELPKDPFEGAELYASNNTGKFIFTILPKLLEDVSEFWQKNGEKVKQEIRTTPGLKTSYSGDIFPYQCDQMISRIGLYVDTVLLTDPLIKVMSFPDGFMTDRNRVYYIIKYVINVLNIKDAFYTDLEYPLVCLYPNERFVENKRQNAIGEETVLDTLTYFNDLLGTKIGTLQELTELLDVDEDQLSDMIKEKNLLPPHYFDSESTIEGLRQGVKERKDQGISYLEDQSTGRHLFEYVFGRLTGISDHIMDCLELNAKALYNVPSSWFMYNWKISKDSNSVNQKIGLDTSTSVVNALQLDDFKWMGNVPVESLIKIREDGGLSEIRSSIRRNVEEIYTCNQSDLDLVAREISKTLKEDFTKHEKELADLSQEYQKKLDLLEKLLMIGTISITVSHFLPPIGALSILGGGFNDVLSATDEYAKKIDGLKEKPIGIMFDAYEDSH